MNKYLVLATFDTEDGSFSVCREYQDDSDYIQGEKDKIASWICGEAGMGQEDIYEILVFGNGLENEAPVIIAHWTMNDFPHSESFDDE